MRTRTVEEVLDMVKHGLKAAKFAPNQNGFQISKKRQVSDSIKGLMSVAGLEGSQAKAQPFADFSA